MRAFCKSLMYIVALLWTGHSIGAVWTELGPKPISTGSFSGRISAVAADPVNANRFFAAGASGGVWRTLDGGVTWTPLTDQLPTAAIGALAMDPNNSDIIYAGSGEANYANHSLYGLGLYKSIDGGDNWQVLGVDTFGGRTFSRIVVSHADGQVVYAAIGNAGGFPAKTAAKNHPRRDDPVGVYRSLDGGATWSQLTNGLPSVAATDLVMDPANANVLYAGIGHIFGQAQNGVYKTTNGGDSWSLLGGGLPANMGRHSLAIAPADAMRVYALITRPCDSTGGGGTTLDLYRSDDAGMSWLPTGPGSMQATYGWYLSTVVVHPTDPDTYLIGGLILLRSTDGGGLYSDVTPPHVDLHALEYAADGTLICGGDGGVHTSADDGDSWVSRNDGLAVVQFYPGISVNPTNPTFLLGGTQDNGTNRRDGGLSWSQRLGGDGGYTALHPANPNTMFGEFQGTVNLYKSTNGGTNFNLSNSGIITTDRNCFLPPVTFSPFNSTTIFYGTHRVYGSINTGMSWTPISGDLTGGGTAAIRGLVVAPSDVQTLYATTNDGRLLVSTDGGVNFTLRLSGIPGWVRVKREVAVDPTDDAIAYLAVANFGVAQIRMTTNHGLSWTTIDGDLPDVPVNTVAVEHRGASSTVFLGTDAGVYMSCDTGGHWRKLGMSLPNVPVMDLVVDLTFQRLVAATLGRGAWSIPLPPLGDVDIDSDVDMKDYRQFGICFSGAQEQPGFITPSLSCLQSFDFDADGDIDLEDYLCYNGQLDGP